MLIAELLIVKQIYLKSMFDKTTIVSGKDSKLTFQDELYSNYSLFSYLVLHLPS